MATKITSEPNIHRQLTEPGSHWASSHAASAAATEPTTIANWYMNPSPPRHRAGASSLVYMGEAIEHSPTPRPPTTRKTLKVIRSLGMAVKIEPTASSRQAAISVLRRPMRSQNQAPKNGPKMQPMPALAVVNPKSMSDMWNCSFR